MPFLLAFATTADDPNDVAVWAWIGGAALLFCIHFVIHPLAKLFRHSLLVLQRRKMPLLLVMLLQAMAWYAHTHHLPGLPVDESLTAPHFSDWPEALLASIGMAIKRMAWSLHSVSHSDALFLMSPMLMLTGLFFIPKTGDTMSSREKIRAAAVLAFCSVLAGVGVAVVVGWLTRPDIERDIIRALLGGASMAWLQVWFCRGIADSSDASHPVLYASAETSRRWDRILLLGLFYAPLLWMSESTLMEVRFVGSWIVPEFLILLAMLPMMIASTRYSIVDSGGAAVLLLKSIWLPVSGLLISAATGFTLAEYATRVFTTLLHDSKPMLEAAIIISIRSLLQCWLCVSCGLLLLRSGYLRPVQPPSS
jgi:hypothetical protein